MKTSFSITRFFTPVIFSACCVVNAHATIVQSALAPNKTGISVDLLFSSTANNSAINTPVMNNAALRPDGMNSPSKAIHLGTNADIFKSGSDFWIRYTLDSTSTVTNIPWWFEDPITTSSVSGEFWLKYSNSTLTVNASRINNDAGYLIADSINTSSVSGPQQIFSDAIGSPFACAPQPGSGCEWNSTFNLSFLTVINGQLFTSATGYDVLFTEHALEGETVNRQYNLAPVPVPAAAWLIGSGLVGLIGLSRRRIAR